MNNALYLILLVASCLSGFATDPAIPQPDVSFFTKLRMDYSQRKDFSPAWKVEDDRQAVIAKHLTYEWLEQHGIPV